MIQDSATFGRPMRVVRALVSALCALALVAALASPAAADTQQPKSPEETNNVNAAVDVLILRPLGLVYFAVGVALCVPATAIAAITRPTDIAKPFKELVIAPARYVWVDPLGAH